MSGEPSSGVFSPAKIAWELDSAGRQIPRSLDFDECYFSSQDGLAETRHVFLAGNRLADRFKRLAAGERFVIAETGFGVGLNFLAAAELWQQSSSKGELHFISTELFGVSGADLRRAHASFPELDGISEQLLKQYPALIPGVHRVHFAELKITLDLWFGEASASLTNLVAPNGVDAWFLDGFSPRQNLDLWASAVFDQVARLSSAGTTAATYSAARAVKQGLLLAGFAISKTSGFGTKRHMILAFKPARYRFIKPQTALSTPWLVSSALLKRESCNTAVKPKPGLAGSSVVVVGAGIAGLCMSYQLAQAGAQVTLIDEVAPLHGASGNPCALLAPKLTPYAFAHEHLHTQSFLFATRFYRELEHSSGLAGLFEQSGVLDRPKHRKDSDWEKLVAGYPPEFVQLLSADQSERRAGVGFGRAMLIPAGGSLRPDLIAKAVLAEPKITFLQGKLTHLDADRGTLKLQTGKSDQTALMSELKADHVVLCTAKSTGFFIDLADQTRVTRGQLSILGLPKPILGTPLKFGGYAMGAGSQKNPKLLFGATNERDFDQSRDEPKPSAKAHLSNLQKLEQNVCEIYNHLSLGALSTHLAMLEASTGESLGMTDGLKLSGRVSERFQLPDHQPLIGQAGKRLSILSALGSKGFCYAPWGAQVIVNQLAEAPNLASLSTLQRLSPLRFTKAALAT